MQPAKNLDEHTQRMTKFVQVEGIRDFRKHMLAKASSSDKKAEKKLHGKRHTLRIKEPTKGPSFNQYMPLNAPWVKILEKALDTYMMPTPKRKLTPRMQTEIGIA